MNQIMDELDIGIVRLLDQDGRMSNVEVAKHLGVSEGAVRLRLKRLIDGRVLRIQPMLNMYRLRPMNVAVMGLSIEGRQLERCAENISEFPEVLSTMVVAGRFDLLITLLLKDHESLTEFVTRRLSKVPGVRNSETFVCLKKCDPWIGASGIVRQD